MRVIKDWSTNKNFKRSVKSCKKRGTAMAQNQLPNSLRTLEKRIYNEAGGNTNEITKISKTVSMVALAQMMPPGAIKGGTAMKIRFGAHGRFSLDIDVARAQATKELQMSKQTL
jgi:hypothetical protein